MGDVPLACKSCSRQSMIGWDNKQEVYTNHCRIVLADRFSHKAVIARGVFPLEIKRDNPYMLLCVTAVASSGSRESRTFFVLCLINFPTGTAAKSATLRVSWRMETGAAVRSGGKKCSAN